jgi:hypothetical protein
MQHLRLVRCGAGDIATCLGSLLYRHSVPINVGNVEIGFLTRF